MTKIRGSELPEVLQGEALARFVHRYTGDHVPTWVKRPRSDGKPYPLHFASDRDWLANTLFYVTEAGRIAARPGRCESIPTWPHGRE